VEQTVKAKNERHLLIVDDDSDMRLLLAEYFRRLGYEVEERESAAAALEVSATRRFDCFIFDVSFYNSRVLSLEETREGEGKGPCTRLS